MIVVNSPPSNPAERTPADPAAPRPPLFSEWADPHYLDTRPVRDPGPCPICATPSHACTDHLEAPMPAPVRETVIQGTPEANADPGANLYVCPDDIVEEYAAGPPGRTQRLSQRLLHHKGEVIPRNRAIQLGLVEGEMASPPIPPPPGATAEGEPVTMPQQ